MHWGARAQLRKGVIDPDNTVSAVFADMACRSAAHVLADPRGNRRAASNADASSMLSVAGRIGRAGRRQQENRVRTSSGGARSSLRRQPPAGKTRRGRQPGAVTVAYAAESAIRSPLEGRIIRPSGESRLWVIQTIECERRGNVGRTRIDLRTRCHTASSIVFVPIEFVIILPSLMVTSHITEWKSLGRWTARTKITTVYRNLRKCEFGASNEGL